MTKDGGPAYPGPDYVIGDLNKDGFQKLGSTRGMSLRDYFATAALTATAGEHGMTPEMRAHFSYEYADAMLTEREKS